MTKRLEGSLLKYHSHEMVASREQSTLEKVRSREILSIDTSVFDPEMVVKPVFLKQMMFA